ncbi:type VI secretion system ATPase TssH [Paraburkholderia sp. SEWSISQ10-3 4]|uniref:type VI secretion system ATPase TssH n=1 Tax=Paraburkholderia TaxID=1822464 RepID=UPI0022577C4F|nr:MULTISPECIES: type VI secretion system ATPase TssH [Paraburkholderia]MCX4138343.1 type VI secretion system ATPase TssH [Paraburkholderia aspalathi]MDN7171033.1 type VI secretion system ATPase TssH [Paraburkholderia sp. SEWSISQ10-3 4]MDQ6500672.1 type VI secretion system ATPase TssH [Paraburkholderia aspalathi]
MTARDLSPFLRRLNDHCARALAEAANLCEARAHRDIEVEHWLIKLLELGEGDLVAIVRRYDLDVDSIWNGLLSAIDRLPHELRGKPGLSHRLGQLLEAAWMGASLEAGATSIRSAHLFAALADAPHLLRAPDAWPLLSVSAAQIERLRPELDRVSVEALTSVVHTAGNVPSTANTSNDEHSPSGMRSAVDTTAPATPTRSSPAIDSPRASLPERPGTDALQRFTIDITQKARDGRIDPVFGREVEIRQMVDILARRRKNNPILVGEPGVGKTALVEGLALKIAEGDVPAVIRDVSVLTLDLGLLQAGAGVKGEFEQRLKNVIEAVQQSPTPILLFIDEAHTLIGAGNSAGGADAANLLKPALARGELRTIAATTWSEYKQYFERDAALERRFQMVKVDEPDDDNACLMLRDLKERYAMHHGVHITDAAVAAAVRLSRRYLTGRQLPDKAVDLLDTAAARVSMGTEATPVVISARLTERAALEVERAALIEDQGVTSAEVSERLNAIETRLASVASELGALEAAFAEQKDAATVLQTLRQQWHAATDESIRSDLQQSIRAAHETLAKHGADALIHAEVDDAAIARVIADWTGVPVGSLLEDELATLLDMETRLSRVVVGQDDALAALGKSLRAAKAGLKSDEAPLGVFLLVGPSGVGKTETARALADLMFGGERALITINLSEYQEAHTVSQLKGSPPGYVGYGQGGVLTEAVRQRPYSVILLDEVEKAHRDVLNLFYQVFDRGFMRDGEGRIIDFRNTVILMTSNLGSEQIMAARDAVAEAGGELSTGMLMEAIRPLLIEHFQPALLARFQTVVYRPLSDAALASIVRMKLDKVARRIERRFGVPLVCNDALVSELAHACQLPDSGARNIDSLLDQQILPVLSRELLVRIARHRLPRATSGGKLPRAIRLSLSDDDGITVEFDDAAEALT